MYDLFDTFLNPWYDDSEYNKKAPKIVHGIIELIRMMNSYLKMVE